MLFTAHIYVSLKPGVNDPQGATIMGSLKSLGFEGVQDVRAGKYLMLSIDASTHKRAINGIEDMCQKLLANPVIEMYEYNVTEAS